jgi:hypothetical protein
MTEFDIEALRRKQAQRREHWQKVVAASRKRKAEAKLSPDALKCPDPRVSRAAANAWLIKRGLPTGEKSTSSRPNMRTQWRRSGRGGAAHRIRHMVECRSAATNDLPGKLEIL